MDIKQYIHDVPDFPIKGIVFKDVAPLVANPAAFRATINLLAKHLQPGDIIVSPGARGFLFGAPLAVANQLPFVMVRKPQKLPGQIISESYELEYGNSYLTMQVGALKPGDQVVIVDDILATGGTVNAIIKLATRAKATVRKILFVAELGVLQGRTKIDHIAVEALVTYD